MGESYVSVVSRKFESILYFCKSIKEKECGEVLLYKHKQSGNYVVVKKLERVYPAYERLLESEAKTSPLHL